jgi:hypothetical protein
VLVLAYNFHLRACLHTRHPDAVVAVPVVWTRAGLRGTGEPDGLGQVGKNHSNESVSHAGGVSNLDAIMPSRTFLHCTTRVGKIIPFRNSSTRQGSLQP